MRMKGARRNPMQRVQLDRTPKKAKKKVKIDPVTGLKLIDRGWHDEIVRPPLPSSFPKDPKTVEEWIQHLHYILVKDWNDPDSVSTTDMVRDTIMIVHRLGFKGHFSDWYNNIMAGKLVAGKIDRTPSKIEAKVKEPASNEG